MYRYLTIFSLLLFFACANNASKDQATTESSEAATIAKTAFKEIDVATFKKIIKQPGLFAIDVRTPKEIADGKIRGAIEVDFKAAGFKEKISRLPKDKKYVIYCRSGNRSGKTAKMMADMGFQDVSNLLGGYDAWSTE